MKPTQRSQNVSPRTRFFESNPKLFQGRLKPKELKLDSVLKFKMKSTQSNNYKNKVKFIKYDKMLGDRFFIKKFKYNFTKNTELPGLKVSESAHFNSGAMNLVESNSKLVDMSYDTLSKGSLKHMLSSSNQEGLSQLSYINISHTPQATEGKLIDESQQKSNLFHKDRHTFLSLTQMELIIREKGLGKPVLRQPKSHKHNFST